MVLGSATAFGTLGILAKLAYASGLGTEQTLAIRFLLAAIAMTILAIALDQNPLRLERRQLVALFGLGAIVYTAQSLTYFIALRSIPASLAVLIAYIYPSLVVVAGWLFLRRAVSIWHGLALAASFAGVALLVGGAHLQLTWALALALASPTIYTSSQVPPALSACWPCSTTSSRRHATRAGGPSPSGSLWCRRWWRSRSSWPVFRESAPRAPPCSARGNPS